MHGEGASRCLLWVLYQSLLNIVKHGVHVCVSPCQVSQYWAVMAVMGEKMSWAGSGLLSSISAAHCPPVTDGPQHQHRHCRGHYQLLGLQPCLDHWACGWSEDGRTLLECLKVWHFYCGFVSPQTNTSSRLAVAAPDGPGPKVPMVKPNLMFGLIHACWKYFQWTLWRYWFPSSHWHFH